MADNYGHLGKIYLQQGELREAEKMFRHALEIELTLGQSERAAGYYLDLGRICMQRKAVAQARELFARGLDLYTELDNKEGQVKCLVRLGLACQQNGNFNRAESWFKSALETMKSGLSHVTPIKAAVYNYLGALYLERSDGNAAVKVLNKAHSLYQSLGEAKGLGLVYGHLGLASMIQGRPGKARVFLISAIRINRRLGQASRAADNLANLACLYYTRGKTRSAAVMYYKAMRLFQSAGHKIKYEQTRALLDGMPVLQAAAEPA